MNKGNEFLIYAFYRFVKVNDKKKLKHKIDNYCQHKTIRGTILISDEGINATISGVNYDLLQVTKIIKTDLCIRKLNIKINVCNFLPFNRMKVRIKKEIVTMGIKNLDVNRSKAKYLNPTEWNKNLNRDNVKIIDIRNNYEIAIGKFKNSINIQTNSFREFPSKFESIKVDKKEKILMYCTGGIRCEKASAYLINKGYKNVYQLNGGIIEYTRQVKEHNLENKFLGKNFVFDNRMSERISGDIISNCHQCGDKCDEHVNCNNEACHLLFIQCDSCAKKYDGCCSIECSEIYSLPIEKQKELRGGKKNSSKIFKKGRFKEKPLNKI